MKKYALGILVGLFVISSGLTKAQNLVQNPGFETSGEFTDYMTQAAPEASYFGVNSSNPHSGSNSAFFASGSGTNDYFDYISQSLDTTVGTTYEISFYLAVDGTASDNEFLANIGGTLESSQVDESVGGRPDYISGGDTFQDISSNASPYTEYFGSFTASSTTTNLIFGGENATSYSYLDDISVTAVPEPSIWGLLITGLGFLACGAGRPFLGLRKN
jgi:hypothetical protein